MKNFFLSLTAIAVCLLIATGSVEFLSVQQEGGNWSQVASSVTNKLKSFIQVNTGRGLSSDAEDDVFTRLYNLGTSVLF